MKKLIFILNLIFGMFIIPDLLHSTTQYYGVFIGIEDYQYVTDLSYCIDDITDAKDMLYYVGNLGSGNWTTLTNSGATETAIQTAISDMRSSEDSDDICIFYFSGHGVDTGGLFTYESNTITPAELGSWFSSFETNKIIIILDCCYAGQFNNCLNKGCILMACQSDESAQETAGLQNGVFSYFDCEGMKGYADLAGSAISGEEVFSYSDPLVLNYTSNAQDPLLDDDYAGSLDFLVKTFTLSGSLSHKEIWSGTVTATGNVTVPNGIELVTLTSTIKFPENNKLSISGKLSASYANFILNGNPMSTSWEGIRLESGSQASSLLNCTIKTAQKGVYDLNSQANNISYTNFDSCGYGIYANGSGNPSYNNGRFRWCSQDAIRLEGTDAIMYNIKIQNNFDDGFWFTSSCDPDVWSSLAESNSGYGAYCYNYSTPDFISTSDRYASTIRDNGNTEVYAYNATPKLGDASIQGYAPALNAIYDDSGNLISLYFAGTVKAEKVWWGENPPPTGRMTTDGYSTLDYDPYAEYDPYWSYKAAGGKTEPSPTLLTPFVNGMREKAKGNFREAIQSFKLQIDSLPHTQEAIQAMVKLKGLDSRDHYEEYDGDILSYLNTVTNTSPQLLIPSTLVSAKILEGRGYYGDVIEIFDYLLSDRATTNESVLYQAFVFYLMRMGDINKAGELASYMQGLNSADPAAVKCMMNDLEVEKDHVIEYMGELSKSGVYNIGKNAKSIIDGGAIPVQYNIHPAYPNPFNPTTTISFELPEVGEVDISIYNVLGQKVATLVNEPLVAGNHHRDWDASIYGSGIYFVRMHARNFEKTIKITFLK